MAPRTSSRPSPLELCDARNLLTIPNNDHFGDVDKSCMGLVKLPAVEKSGLLWVHLTHKPRLMLMNYSGPWQRFPSFGMHTQVSVGQTTIEKNLNWKFANDTFGETYHFGKLHKDTLGRLYYGNNLHFEEFGRHHRFVTANRGIDARTLPESIGIREVRLFCITFFLTCS